MSATASWRRGLAALGTAVAATAAPAAGQQAMAPVGRSQLCVTEGAIEAVAGGRMAVSVPKMRAVVTTPTAHAVAARFTYLGPTGETARLGSGTVRRQLGLKLRAQDACNLVYAIWRIAPEEQLVVSVKSNSGQHTSAECGNHGYRNIKPARSQPLPPLGVGATHELRATIAGETMTVAVDGSVAWEGRLDPVALSFDGPVGIRSDNARFEFVLAAPPAESNSGSREAACSRGGED